MGRDAEAFGIRRSEVVIDLVITHYDVCIYKNMYLFLLLFVSYVFLKDHIPT